MVALPPQVPPRQAGGGSILGQAEPTKGHRAVSIGLSAAVNTQ